MSGLNAFVGWLNTPAFHLWGAPATWVELLGFVTAVLMVIANQRVHPSGWLLAAVSSALYAVVFLQAGLFGEAGLQLFFIAMAAWGAWRWLAGPTAAVDRRAEDRGVRWAPARERWAVLGAWLLLWAAIGLLLSRVTPSTVPWWDAAPTAGSVVATWWLGRKRIDNWLAWVAVNAVSVGLFAYKGLWLTVVLYLLFIALALWGWRGWVRRARREGGLGGLGGLGGAGDDAGGARTGGPAVHGPRVGEAAASQEAPPRSL